MVLRIELYIYQPFSFLCCDLKLFCNILLCYLQIYLNLLALVMMNSIRNHQRRNEMDMLCMGYAQLAKSVLRILFMKNRSLINYYQIDIVENKTWKLFSYDHGFSLAGLSCFRFVWNLIWKISIVQSLLVKVSFKSTQM